MPTLLTEHSFASVPLEKNPAPEVDLSSVPTPWHLTPEILSHFPKALAPCSLMLDPGYGEAVHQQVTDQAGFEWIGVDCR